MHRPLTAAAAVLAVVALLAGSCTRGADRSAGPGVLEACLEYHRLLNQWSAGYGAELGAVGQAVAAGDPRRRETAVAVVRELFTSAADGLREQAGRTADQELAGALTEAADGLAEIAGQIRSYDDVTGAPALMSSGRFARGGERVSEICAE
jgi:hypothetical protein